MERLSEVLDFRALEECIDKVEDVWTEVPNKSSFVDKGYKKRFFRQPLVKQKRRKHPKKREIFQS